MDKLESDGAGLGGCAILCATFPLYPDNERVILVAAALLGVLAGATFGSSYQLVSHFGPRESVALTTGGSLEIQSRYMSDFIEDPDIDILGLHPSTEMKDHMRVGGVHGRHRFRAVQQVMAFQRIDMIRENASGRVRPEGPSCVQGLWVVGPLSFWRALCSA